MRIPKLFFNLSNPGEGVPAKHGLYRSCRCKGFSFSTMLNEDIISSESVGHC